MKNFLSTHQEKVESIKKCFRECKKDHSPFTLSKSPHSSNTVRENAYHKKGQKLNLKKLNQILSIDKERKIVVTEPGVTMEQLVDFTLKHDLLPPVVPEFKGITVGGAIMGAAIESSSHLRSQFNDSCLSYEVLIGDGSVIIATPLENSDLFYGISGSYGTFGILLSISLQLIPASQWIEIETTHFSDVSSSLEYMKKVHYEQSLQKPFVEAIIFQKNDISVITADWWKNEKNPPKNLCFLSHFYSPFFYQSIKEIEKKNSEKRFMKVKDYIFRHDRGAFWMSSYLLHGSLLLRFVLDRFGYTPNWLKKWNSHQGNSYHKQKYPGKIFRLLFGWALSSQTLYKILHAGTEKWFSKHFVIQDFYIPEENANKFIEMVLNNYEITPLWLCPVSPTDTPQFLSPHFKKDYLGILFDVGIYGFPQSKINGERGTQDLEQKAKLLSGRKMLYGDCYYKENDLWQIYSLNSYTALRKKYCAENSWLNLTEKLIKSE